MLKYGNVLPYTQQHTYYIAIEESGNTVFIVTVKGTCTTLSVSRLFDVYQHYQTNSKLELVILRFNILKCVSDRIGAGTRYFGCLFFIQQHSEAAGNKRMSSTVCRVVEVLHGRLNKKDSGSSKDTEAVFSCCKVSVKEKNKHSDLTT